MPDPRPVGRFKYPDPGFPEWGQPRAVSQAQERSNRSPLAGNASFFPPTNDQTPSQRRAAMTWAQRLKRVFNIDIETCADCDGMAKIIRSIED